MRKILSFLLIIIGLYGYSQDEYYRIIDWKFYPENVIQLTDSTYLTDAYPFDYNDVGAIQRVVGNYVVDFVGHRYSVIDSTSTTITVLDIYHIGQAPQTGQIARCYRSVGDGEAEYIGSIDYSPLDESSRWKLNGSDNELLWRQTIGKAENGLYKELRTVKLGGDLTEPTVINQDDNSLKILNNGHGSVFSETGIAYTKIDTALFGDSTLITKMYANSRISDAAYSSLWNSIATVSPSKNAVYDKIETLTPVNYCPLSMTVNTGTLVQGSVSDLCEVGGTDVIISESTGADPLRVTFAFNPVQRLTSFSFYGRYNGGATHVTYLEAYNYIAAEWQLIGELGNTPIKQWQSYNVFLPTKFISSGAVQVRFNHQGNGINTHQLILDYVDVNYGGAGGSSFETASEIAFIPNGNIESTNVQAAIQELDTEKEPLLTKGNLTAGSSKVAIGGTGTGAVIGSGTSIDVNEANIVHQNIFGHGTNTHAQIDTHITNDGDLSSTNEVQDLSLSGNTLSLSGDASPVDLSVYEPAFSKNTAFNKNFGTTTGTVLQGRTFGTAANNNTEDFHKVNRGLANGNLDLLANGNQFVSQGNTGSNFSGDLDNILFEGTVANFNGYQNLGNTLGFKLAVPTSGNQGLYYTYAYVSGLAAWRRVYDSGNANLPTIAWNASQYKLAGVDLFGSLTNGNLGKWDGTKFINGINLTVQSLSGTTPSLNATNGVNANLTISGATTLTLSNLISGTSGTIYLTNNASVYRIKIAGYTITPASNITYNSTGILLPASSVWAHTSIGWYYNGTTVQIHKADYNSITY